MDCRFCVLLSAFRCNDMDSLITDIIYQAEAELAEMELPYPAELYQSPAEAERILGYSDAELTTAHADTRHAVAADMARLIDHTLLKAEATPAQIRKLCEEARQYGFVSVCVNPTYVPLSATLLANSEVKVCTVIGFPLGATTTATKQFEAQEACRAGASEVDMVLAVGYLKHEALATVAADIAAVADVAHDHGAMLKVIFETSLLSDKEKVQASVICRMAGADFVKTSTGFGGGGATVEDVALMRQVVGTRLGVKASGGIRDAAGAVAMIRAGATRIGASAGAKIVQQLQSGLWQPTDASASPY
jgi:deoxyribose-phosphate aldolase